MPITIDLTWKDTGTVRKQAFALNAGTDLVLRFALSGTGSIAGKTLRLVMSDTTEDPPLIDKVHADFTVDEGTDEFEVSIAAALTFDFGNNVYHWEVRQVDAGNNRVLAMGNANCTANPLASGAAPEPADLPVTWDQVANKPTTLGGYGITDAASDAELAVANVATIGVSIDGGGSVISPGVKGYINVPYGGTILSATLVGDVAGSIVIDVWRRAFSASTLPAASDSIAASAKPTLSNAKGSTNSTLTGWITSFSAGDTFGFNVDAAAVVTKATLTLKVRKS